jgi:hypothetical protein
VLSPEVLEYARCPDRYTYLSPGVERIDFGSFCVIQGPHWAGVTGLRIESGEIDATVERVHELVPAEKHLVWWFDDDVRPTDLVERLRERGFREPADNAPLLYAIACVEAPAPGPPDVEVRRVTGYDDYLAAQEVMWRAFKTTPERRAQQEPHVRSEFESAQEAGTPATFLALLDDRPAALGRSLYSDRGVFLIAGAVEEWARGRGVYRSLVRARWEDAVARGTPALVTETIPDTSYPILKRLGFVDVCTMRRLEDVR